MIKSDHSVIPDYGSGAVNATVVFYICELLRGGWEVVAEGRLEG
jgi:hypothetical protein